MKIIRAEASVVKIPLKAPFTIAFHTTYDAELILLQLITDGPHVGIGVAAPFEQVTGESLEACANVLSNDLSDWIAGTELEHPSILCAEMATRYSNTPAARAAADQAFKHCMSYDLSHVIPHVIVL